MDGEKEAEADREKVERRGFVSEKELESSQGSHRDYQELSRL